MKIKELMTTNVRVCQPSDNLSVAAQAMWESDVGCLAVVDGEGKLTGMITDRDICMAAHLRGAPLWAVAVSEAMAKVVYTCRPEQKLDEVLAVCVDKRVRRVPIVDDAGKLVGLVTLSSLAHAIDSDGKHKPGVSAKDVCQAFSEVTRRREAPVSARMEVEVTRETAEAKGLLTPAPRAAGKHDAKPAEKQDSKSKPAGDKKPKKSRAGK